MTDKPDAGELLPCPFCGCDQLKISPNIHTGLLRVQCEGCWATSVTSNNRVNLVAAWNRRSSSKRIEELEKALKAIRRHNDSPMRFSVEIDNLANAALSPSNGGGEMAQPQTASRSPATKPSDV